VVDPQQHVHFVGIGGAGMSALAEVLLARGYTVSGCDIRPSEATTRLEARGAVVQVGHSPAHLPGVDLVVATRAVRAESAELLAAHAQGLRVWHRAELLGQLMGEARSIAVAGTHGKTTTTAMTAAVLIAGGLDPTALVGADVVEFGGNARVGASPWMVAEVDESDGSLLHVAPWAAAVTSLDLTDHADFYASADHLRQTFERFLEGVKSEGFAVLCADHPIVAGMTAVPRVSVVTYGLSAQAEFAAEVEELSGTHSRAVVRRRGRRLGRLTLQVPGRHNMVNALAATAVGLQVGVDFAAVARGLAGFRGVRRRFEVRGDVDGILVVDDYAHNPVKVAAALRAARECWPGRRVVAVFQPHRFSRTRTTHAQFADAFRDADEVYVTEIYAADEDPLPGVSAALIVDAVRRRRPVHFAASLDEAAAQVGAQARAGDLILTLGAGDVWSAADRIVDELRARVRP
jgi:UDP-N-acetylmuramate--alanine ligase